MSGSIDERRDAWFAALQARYTRHLSFPEIRRAVQALSSLYVERRERLATRGAFDSDGKRSAYGLFFGPLHYFAVDAVVRALGAQKPPPRRIVELGCGTGAAAAAWWLACGGTPVVSAFDRSAWAVQEARWTFSCLGLAGSVHRRDLDPIAVAGQGNAILAAYVVNELAGPVRDRLLARLLDAAGRGAAVLVVEPIARRPLPWWDEWAEALRVLGGREDAWRFRLELPAWLRQLDRAAGLRHDPLCARSLWSPGRIEP